MCQAKDAEIEQLLAKLRTAQPATRSKVGVVFVNSVLKHSSSQCLC
jgi:hypothetical protein